MDQKEIAARAFSQPSQEIQEAKETKEQVERRLELDALMPITFEGLEAVVRKWMIVVDKGLIKLLPAIIIANRFPGDPLWVYIIGASGGGKTEFLQALFDLPEIYPMSLLTTTTFLSGMPGKKDTSLLPSLNGKVMAFLDWTNMLSINKEAQAELMGQFRDIYGGYMKKNFGTGRVVEWRGKVGIIACTTSVVDFSQQRNASLGERFTHYRIDMPDRIEAASRALANSDKQEQMRKELRNAYYAYLKGITMPETEPELPTDYKEELIRVGNFCTLSRSAVIRDFGFKKEVVFVPAPEMPTRLIQQISKLARAFIVLNGDNTLHEEDMATCYKMAFDCIPSTNYIVIKQLARMDEQTTAQVATGCGYPTAPIRIYLENLALLGVCTRIRGVDSEEGGNADRWTLLPEFVEIMKKYEDIRPVEPEPVTLSDDLPPLDQPPPEIDPTKIL